MIRLFVFLFVTACCLAAVPARAEHEGTPHPLWEAGAAGGWVRYNVYPGADSRKVRMGGAPYLIYRGKYVRASGRAVRLVLLERERFWIDLSGSAWPSVESAPSRTGMPDLDLVFQLGPRLNRVLVETDRFEARARLSLRAAFSAENAVDYAGEGYVAEPQLRLHWRPMGGDGPLNVRLTVTPLFGSADYNAYYYDVAPAFAIPGRPAHHAGPGLVWWAARLSLSWKLNRDVKVGVFAEPKWLDSGSVDGSPLVETNHALTVGCGLNWVLWRSEREVSGRRINGEAER